MNHAACFLDRDGVVIEEVHYLSDPEQVRLLPGAAKSIARLNALKVPVVVATNQAGVAHGYFPETRVVEIHRRLDELLIEQGALVDRYYYCPHHPQAKVAQYRLECACRKPSPGMLQQAAAELKLDLRRSFLIGDKLSDIEAGIQAGCQVVLTLTGYGAVEMQSLKKKGADPFFHVLVAADLAEAVDICLPELSPIHRAA
jgi:D-glycero-D-manno-heptose 1,7-bisphosphate phosphatase